MSETDNQATSILLPPSSVAVYSNDQETLEAGRDVIHDWRFARVQIQVEEGDVATATNAYKDTSSPDLIIVQTETIDDTLPAQLEDLAGNCDEGTAAIVIGPVNDVALYRQLIDMGVSDYLVKPVETPFLADVIAKALIEKIGVTGSRLLAFLGAKGGVGTTSLAEAASWGAADILEQKVMLIDSSGGWSSLSVGMGFEPSTTLSEAAKAAANDDEDSLNRMLFNASERLSVLASGGDVMLEPAISAEQMEQLLDTMMIKYPVVIADLSHATPDIEKAVIARAHQIIVVSTPTLPSLRLARSLIQEVRDVRGGDNEEEVELIINMQGVEKSYEMPTADIEKAMDLSVSSIIPFAPELFLSTESESKKLIDNPEGLKIARSSLLPVMQKILAIDVREGEPEPQAEEGVLGSLLGKLKAK